MKLTLEELLKLSQNITQQQIFQALNLQSKEHKELLLSVAFRYILIVDEGVQESRDLVKGVGWSILKNLDQKEVVQEGDLLRDLLSVNCEEHLLDHKEIPKIISWISETQNKGELFIETCFSLLWRKCAYFAFII